MFCGGGSAGHVIPNIAVIEDIKKDYSVCYAGTDAIEENICRTNNVEFHKFEAVKLIRGKIFRNILIPFKLLKSIKQAGEILDRPADRNCVLPCLFYLIKNFRYELLSDETGVYGHQ